MLTPARLFLVLRSLRRSALRHRALACLERFGACYHEQLADAAGVSSSRLRDVIDGNDKDYLVARSLLTLALVQATLTNGTTIYRITDLGRAALAEMRYRQSRAFYPRVPR